MDEELSPSHLSLLEFYATEQHSVALNCTEKIKVICRFPQFLHLNMFSVGQIDIHSLS